MTELDSPETHPGHIHDRDRASLFMHIYNMYRIQKDQIERMNKQNELE